MQSDSALQPMSTAAVGRRRVYSGLVDCVVTSWRVEGPSVFFRGLTVTCLRAFPTNAVILVVYVNALRLLDG